MERRVLIVESQSDFALSMASVLKGVGYQTALAGNAADAQRELEKRRPDLVVLRAELPDQSGFILCGQIKKGRFGQNLRVLLLSSDVGQEGLSQHSQTPNAADGYLTIPFEMGDLASMTAGILPPPSAAPGGNGYAPDGAPPAMDEGTGDPGGDDMDASLDNAIARGTAPAGSAEAQQHDQEASPQMPPPLRVAQSGPPRLPKRERRSAITEEDKSFLDRTFQSIADRKTELLAESRQVKRAPMRRDLMGTPEGKIQILREELKSREAQIARLSEIWSVRERELLSVEDRVHEKDVELQGLKMQVDDLLRRFNEAQQTLLQKEREHGATVDDLLIQKFATEKDLIEVVAAKEKDINVLRKEVAARDEELTRRAQEIEGHKAEYEKLEKTFNVETLDFEVKHKQAAERLAERDQEIATLKNDLSLLEARMTDTVLERDGRYAQYEHAYQTKEAELQQEREERDATVRALNADLSQQRSRADAAEQELAQLTQTSSDLRDRFQAQVEELTADLGTTRTERDEARAERDQNDQMARDRLAERDAKIASLEADLSALTEKSERTEADLGAQLQQKLEQLGELEGEVESLKADLKDTSDQLTQANEQIFSLQTEGSVKDGAIAELNGQLQALQETSEKTQQDMIARLRAADDALAQAHTQAADVSALLQSVTGERDAVQQRLVEEQEENQRQLAEERQAAQQKLADERESFRGQVAELQDTAQRRLSDLEARLQAAEDSLVQEQAQSSETSALLQSMTGERDALQDRVTDLDETLSQAQAAAVSLEDRLANEAAAAQASLADLRGQQEAERAAAEATQAELFETGAERDSLKQELGQKLQELTALTSQLAQAEEARAAMDDRLASTIEEGARREELLQSDVAQKSKELSDAQRKLQQLTAERQRLTEQVSRESAARQEAARQGEAKLKAAQEEMRRAKEEFAQRMDAATAESESVRAQMAEALEQAAAEKTQLLAERDALRTSSGVQLQQAQAKIAELQQISQRDKAEAKKIYDEVFAKYSRADQRLAQLTTESQGKVLDLETRLKDAQSQVASRAKRLQELELAVENAHTTRVKLEKELNAKVASAEGRASESQVKLQSALKEKKDFEARVWKEQEDLVAKHKAELERRDQLKAQEVARLQQTVQEKSKALKVVELELARYKGKTGVTNVNALQGAPGAAPAASPGTAPTGTAPRAPTTRVSPGAGPAPGTIAAALGTEDGPTHPSRPAAAPPTPGPKTAVARPTQTMTAKAGASGPRQPGAQPVQPKKSPEDRTAIVQVPEGSDEWSALVDKLDK